MNILQKSLGFLGSAASNQPFVTAGLSILKGFNEQHQASEYKKALSKAIKEVGKQKARAQGVAGSNNQTAFSQALTHSLMGDTKTARGMYETSVTNTTNRLNAEMGSLNQQQAQLRAQKAATIVPSGWDIARDALIQTGLSYFAAKGQQKTDELLQTQNELLGAQKTYVEKLTSELPGNTQVTPDQMQGVFPSANRKRLLNYGLNLNSDLLNYLGE
jgi:hypothetical protein